MIESGTKVKIRSGAPVGQDMRFFHWEGPLDVVFTVVEQLPSGGRYRLRAVGYGDLERDYGNGCVFVNEADLVVAGPSVEELALRRLLFLSHGCPQHQLYGDDGEMQCHECGVDFRRMSAAEIDAAWFRRFKKALTKEALDAKSDSSRDDAPAGPAPAGGQG